MYKVKVRIVGNYLETSITRNGIITITKKKIK